MPGMEADRPIPVAVVGCGAIAGLVRFAAGGLRQAVINYRPRFDLDEGMRLTAEFVRWARLADGDRSGRAG